jgi:hypothetical protein
MEYTLFVLRPVSTDGRFDPPHPTEPLVSFPGRQHAAGPRVWPL